MPWNHIDQYAFLLHQRKREEPDPTLQYGSHKRWLLILSSSECKSRIPHNPHIPYMPNCNAHKFSITSARLPMIKYQGKYSKWCHLNKSKREKRFTITSEEEGLSVLWSHHIFSCDFSCHFWWGAVKYLSQRLLLAEAKLEILGLSSYSCVLNV